MFRAVIDSKNGKVWASHPLDQRMVLVADVEEDADDYLNWSKMMGRIRTAPDEKVQAFTVALEAHLKNIKKNVDLNVNLPYDIKSDRGNPTDLWNNFKGLFGVDSELGRCNLSGEPSTKRESPILIYVGGIGCPRDLARSALVEKPLVEARRN